MERRSVSDLNPDLIGSLDPYLNPDPDPGGHKLPTNIEKLINFIFRSAGCSLVRAEGFSCILDNDTKYQFLITKKRLFLKILLYFFSPVFDHQNPGFGLDPDPLSIQ
jgi:hypothetical protein